MSAKTDAKVLIEQLNQVRPGYGAAIDGSDCRAAPGARLAPSPQHELLNLVYH